MSVKLYAVRAVGPGHAAAKSLASYAAGGTRDPAEAYIAFRGRLPSPDALLRKRGLADPATD